MAEFVIGKLEPVQVDSQQSQFAVGLDAFNFVAKVFSGTAFIMVSLVILWSSFYYGCSCDPLVQLLIWLPSDPLEQLLFGCFTDALEHYKRILVHSKY